MVSCICSKKCDNMNNELHRNYFRGKKQDFTSEILNVIKILLDTPISKSCNAISSKASRIILIKGNSHTIMQILACFTITTSNAGTKVNCRQNRNEVKFESRQNGSRRNGSRQNGSRQNGNRQNGNTPL